YARSDRWQIRRHRPQPANAAADQAGVLLLLQYRRLRSAAGLAGALRGGDHLADQFDDAVAIFGVLRVRDDGDLVDQPRRRQALDLLARLLRGAGDGEALHHIVRNDVAVRRAHDHVLVIFVVRTDLSDDVHGRTVQLERQLAFQNTRNVRFDRTARRAPVVEDGAGGPAHHAELLVLQRGAGFGGPRLELGARGAQE